MSDPAKPQGPEGQSAGQNASGSAAPGSTASAFASASATVGTGQSAQAAASAPPAGDPAALAARIAELESQQADLTDRLLRAHAEMDNLRKRTEREKADTAKYAITKFALEIVGISDNFQRAVSAVPPESAQADGPIKSLVDGVVMTERAFLQVLERNGVKRIDPKGEPFDPNRHQAVMEEQNPELPSGSVSKVFQPGYMIEDRVLRPAMVVVARGGAKPAKPSEPTGAGPAAAPANENGPEQGNGGSAAGA